VPAAVGLHLSLCVPSRQGHPFLWFVSVSECSGNGLKISKPHIEPFGYRFARLDGHHAFLRQLDRRSGKRTVSTHSAHHLPVGDWTPRPGMGDLCQKSPQALSDVQTTGGRVRTVGCVGTAAHELLKPFDGVALKLSYPDRALPVEQLRAPAARRFRACVIRSRSVAEHYLDCPSTGPPDRGCRDLCATIFASKRSHLLQPVPFSALRSMPPSGRIPGIRRVLVKSVYAALAAASRLSCPAGHLRRCGCERTQDAHPDRPLQRPTAMARRRARGN